MSIDKLDVVPGKKGFKYVTMKKSDIMPAIKLVEDELTRK
jgi:hypothetical protein